MSDLQTRVFYLTTKAELERLMALYSSLFTGGQFQRLITLFSNEETDVRAVTPWGTYEGYSGIERLYTGLMKTLYCAGEGVLKPGTLPAHTLNTPTICVAADGATAKGMWYSPGNITIPDSEDGAESFWCWMKLGCDFVYENDTWKIWHLRMFELFTSSFDHAWTEQQNSPYASPVVKRFPPDSAEADRMRADPPQPYRTFSETFSY